MDKPLYDKKTKYGRYRIVDRVYNDRPSRLLLSGDKATPQSGLGLDDNPELLFDYNQRLFEVALSLNPREILAIGGGAFTLPRAMLYQLPNTHIDAVEIDPSLPRLARKYFQLPHSRRLKIITRDGRDYIDNCRKTYDLIVVDAFSEYVIPSNLLSVEAAAQYAQVLTPNGTLAINFIAKYRGIQPTFTHRLMASFKNSFSSIEIYPADPHDNQEGEQNLIMIATNQPVINLDYLLSVRVHPQDLNNQHLQMHD